MQASMAADLEVERRLDDFARGRLTPSAASKARSRARVMREARLAFADQAERAAVAAANQAELPRSATNRTMIRRGGALLAAAALSLAVVGGVFAASTAGGPLYGTRVWLETVTLPADPASRASAEVARLEARLSEVQAAVTSGDRAAVAAALAAYEQIADEALTGAAASQVAIDRLTAALDRHLAVLERVAAQVPPQAAESINRNIEKAINHTDAAITRILAGSTGGTNNGGANNGGTNNGGTNNGAGPAGATDGSGSSEEPAPTPKPKPTPQPHPTAAPAAATPAPTPKTPPGQASPRPEKTPPGKADPSGQSSESGH